MHDRLPGFSPAINRQLSICNNMKLYGMEKIICYDAVLLCFDGRSVWSGEPVQQEPERLSRLLLSTLVVATAANDF